MTSVGLVMEERITAKAGVDYRFYDGKKNLRQAVHDAYNWKDPANEGNDILGWRAEMEMDWESRKKVHKKPDSTVPLDLNRVWFAQAYSSHFIAKNPKKSQAGAAGRSNSKAPSHKVFTGADRRFSPAVLATLESRMPFATNNDVKESAAKRGFVIFDNFMVYALSADEAWNFDLAETMVRDQIALILDGIGNTTQNTIVSYRLWDHDLVRGLRLRHANYDHGPQLSDLIWADQIRNIKRNIKRVQHFASLRDLQRSLLANDLIWDVGKDSEWAGIRRQEISDARKAAKAAKDDDAEYGAVAGQDSSVRHVYTDILYAMDGLVRVRRVLSGDGLAVILTSTSCSGTRRFNAVCGRTLQKTLSCLWAPTYTLSAIQTPWRAYWTRCLRTAARLWFSRRARSWNTRTCSSSYSTPLAAGARRTTRRHALTR